MRISMNLEKKRVTVVGLGQSGEAAAALLAGQGAKVLVVDDEQKNRPSGLTALKAEYPIEFHLGQWSTEDLLSAELIVVSPGVPLSRLPMSELATAEIPVIGEVELASWFLTAPVIAITGTNGKSTTTTLVSEMLKEDGRNVFLGGNIGTPLSLAAFQPFDFIVAEISSFQLETIRTFKPKIAALLNVTDDHLDRHGTLQNYRAIKNRIFENQTRMDYAVINADNMNNTGSGESVGAVSPGLLKGVTVYFSQNAPIPPTRSSPPSPHATRRWRGVYAEEGMIVSSLLGEKEPIIEQRRLKLFGTHNLENVMAAVAITLLAGASREAIVRVLTRFSGLPHRMQPVREVKGVHYIDDSKGTNVGAVMKSLEGIDRPIILIAGGLDKQSDFTPLKEIVLRKVKRLILMGDALEKMADCFRGHPGIERVRSMKEAVLIAAASAAPGDVVLLSPGCASFDMFDNYRHRGQVFQQAVMELS